MVEVVADQIGDDCVLCHYLLLEDMDFILKLLNLTELGSLDNHDVI